MLPVDGEPDAPVSHKSAVSGEVARAIDHETALVKCTRPGQPSANKTFNFERYNVCIMADGQTGGGKTHTVLGPRPAEASQNDSGIIPRASEELFRGVTIPGELPQTLTLRILDRELLAGRLTSEDPSERPDVGVSVVEIYNNDIFDLLAKDSGAVTSGVRCEVLTTKEGRKEV